MIRMTNGNIFQANTQSIVNPVNCVGVMGKGLAAKFKEIYPDMFKAYKAKCDLNEIVPGKIFVWVIDTYDELLYIFNLPTKDNWRHPSKMSYIKSGIKTLIDTMEEHDIHSIAIPALGCGLGGLQWDDVSKEIIMQFQHRAPDKEVWLYGPQT